MSARDLPADCVRVIGDFCFRRSDLLYVCADWSRAIAPALTLLDFTFRRDIGFAHFMDKLFADKIKFHPEWELLHTNDVGSIIENRKRTAKNVVVCHLKANSSDSLPKNRGDVLQLPGCNRTIISLSPSVENLVVISVNSVETIFGTGLASVGFSTVNPRHSVYMLAPLTCLFIAQSTLNIRTVEEISHASVVSSKLTISTKRFNDLYLLASHIRFMEQPSVGNLVLIYSSDGIGTLEYVKKRLIAHKYLYKRAGVDINVANLKYLPPKYKILESVGNVYEEV